MTDRFDVCLPRVLVHEGGYVNHPADPGGATDKGITQRTYDAWNRLHGRPVRPVRGIPDADVAAIYRAQYWSKAGEGLPEGLDYAVFDYAVNSGPAQAARDLQRVLGVKVDGIIGQMTLDAAATERAAWVIQELCKRRLNMLRGLKHWNTFGRGWQRRVDAVLMTAVADASGQRVGVKPEAAPEKADPADKGVARQVTEAVTSKELLATAGGLLGSVGTLASGSGPVQWAIAAVLVLAALTGAVLLLRRREA